MALKFLKKLTERILGKSRDEAANKKAASRKETSSRSGRKPDAVKSGASEVKKSGKAGWAARAPQTAERSGGPRRNKVHEEGRKPAHNPRKTYPERSGRPPQQPEEKASSDGSSISSHAARSIARPSRFPPSRGGHDQGAARMNTAPGSQRPGGAIADSETEKRRRDHAAWSIENYQIPVEEGKRRFQDFDLPSEILHAVADKGFQYCTPIQAMSLEHALAGKNVAGRAQTGTGKTAAFLVAILTRYLRTPEARQNQGGAPRALVIAPTRELVIQICNDADVLGKYCGLRSLAVYGGMDYERQKREVMDAPVDLLVATPGRLLDFVRSRVIDLSKVDTLVIDEADRMLDMGFIPDVRSIINRLPPKEKRCTMLYSATLSEDVMRLAAQWMEEPVRVEIEMEHVTTQTVKQVVYVVTAREKFTVLYNHIQQYPDSRILVFCNRRTTTEDVAESLSRRGIHCETLSGDVNQNRRLRVLEDFREGKVRIVVATDVAGRGLHVDDIGFVINFDFPYEAEDYVHRIGRTGRAGQSGVAVSFADEDESFTIPDIEKFIGEELKCTVLKSDDPLLAKIPEVQRRGHHPVPPPNPTIVADATPVLSPTVEKERTKAPVSDEVSVKSEEPLKSTVPSHGESRVRVVEPKPRNEEQERKTEPQPAVAAKPRPGRFSEEWVPGGQNV